MYAHTGPVRMYTAKTPERHSYREMQTKESREQLLKEKQSTENRIRFLNNEIKAMEAQEKGLLRKQRNRRIFTRGGMLEAFLLEPLQLTDEQVHELLLTAFRQPAVDALLKTMTEKSKNEDAGEETR